MLIRVDPAILKQNSGLISSIGSNINNSGQTVSGMAQGAPSYDGQFAPRLQATGFEALSRTQGFFNQMNDLSDWLHSKAQAFEAADMAGGKGFGNISNEVQVLAPWSWLDGLPIDILNRYLWLGKLFGTAPFFGLLVALLMGNNLFSGIRQGSNLTITKPDTSFGDILKNAEEQEALKKKRQEEIQKWWNSNGLNQANIQVREVMHTKNNPNLNPFNACGSAVLAMIINYQDWVHGGTGKVLDAKTLAKEAVAQGAFDTDSFTNITELATLADKQGFVLLEAKDLSDIKQKVQKGEPQVALLRYGYNNNGNYVPDTGTSKLVKVSNHWVIITELSNSNATIINPYPGTGKLLDTDVKPTTITLDELGSVWRGSGFGIKEK
jgi:hypothetical protein